MSSRCMFEMNRPRHQSDTYFFHPTLLVRIDQRANTAQMRSMVCRTYVPAVFNQS